MELNGKIVLLTGSTSGVGRVAAKMFAQQGATLVLPVRDLEEGKKFREELLVEKPNANITIFSCDFSSLQAIRKFTKEVRTQYDHLDILVNNAGVFQQEKTISVDDHELNFAVNYLAPVLLTRELLVLLKKSEASRIVNVASSMYREGEINFDDLEGNQFNRYKAYSQSKLALILFTKTLASELKGTVVTVNALHPGVIKTNLALKPLQFTNRILRAIFIFRMERPIDGANRIMYLATSPEVANISGEYFEKNKIVKVPELLVNNNVAGRLADKTKELLPLTD